MADGGAAWGRRGGEDGFNHIFRHTEYLLRKARELMHHVLLNHEGAVPSQGTSDGSHALEAGERH